MKRKRKRCPDCNKSRKQGGGYVWQIIDGLSVCTSIDARPQEILIFGGSIMLDARQGRSCIQPRSHTP